MHGSAWDRPSWRGWDWGVGGVPGDGGPQNAFVFSHVPVVVRLLFVRVFIFGFAADLDSDDLWFPAFMQHAGTVIFMCAKCTCQLNCWLDA